jgi:ribose transport system permease protein
MLNQQKNSVIPPVEAPRGGALTRIESGAADTLKRILHQSYLAFVLIAIIIAGSVISPDFFTARNAGNVLNTSAIIAVLAVGQFFVILTGGIDLSVGSVVALSTVITALTLQAGVPAGLAVLFTLVCCAVVGLVNALLIVWMRIPAFIATLAMLSAVKGFSYIIQSTSLIEISNNSFITAFATGTVLGVSNPVVIFVVLTAIAAFVAKYTTFGRQLYAIGGNAEAARLSGLPVGRDLFITYILSGFLAGLAGLIAAAELLEGSSLIGSGYELNSIAAVVVGGASLFGGIGDPISAVIGVFVLGLIANIMNLVGISSQPQLVITGAVVVVAVFLSSAGGVQRIVGFFAKVFGRRQETVAEGRPGSTSARAGRSPR